MSARLYTLQHYELRKLAEKPPRMRWDDDFEPDWRHGLLAVLAFLAALAWLDAKDNEDYYKRAAEKANATVEELKAELYETPNIRWVGKGYVCRFNRLQGDWHAAFMKECTRMGNMLTAARASE